MGVGEDLVAGGAAEELVDGDVQGLALDVPQCQVDGADGGHGHRPAAPVGAAVEVLPGVFDPVRVPAQQCRGEVVAEVAGDGEFAAVEGGVAPADDAIVGGDLQGDEVAAGAGDEDVDVDDFSGHREITTFFRGWFVDRRVMFSAISRARPRKVSAVTPEECGVMMMLSSRPNGSGGGFAAAVGAGVLVPDVDGGAGDPAVLQGLVECGFVDDGAAGHVDELSVGAEVVQFGGADQGGGSGVERDADHEHVGFAEGLAEAVRGAGPAQASFPAR